MLYPIVVIKPKPLPVGEFDLAATHLPGVTVSTDEEFRAAVRQGIASFEAGPTHDLDTVEVELHRIIHAAR